MCAQQSEQMTRTSLNTNCELSAMEKVEVGWGPSNSKHMGNWMSDA